MSLAVTSASSSTSASSTYLHVRLWTHVSYAAPPAIANCSVEYDYMALWQTTKAKMQIAPELVCQGGGANVGMIATAYILQ